MSEGSVRLQGNVKVLVSERNVRAEQNLRYCLSQYLCIAIRVILITFDRLVIYQSVASHHLEHSQWLSHHSRCNIVIAAMESGTVHLSNTSRSRCGEVFAVVVSAERSQFVLLVREVGIHCEFHVF